jgi:hypothetical protein
MNKKKEKLKVKKSILEDPLDDREIREILDNKAKIIKYSELKNYNDIMQLLPNKKTMIILLYEWAYNTGHWTCICRDNNDNIIYYDSYGNIPDEPLNWNTEQINNELGQSQKYLSNLLNKTKYNVIYNPIQYQELKGNLSTCGRHVCIWLLLMDNFNFSLNDYYKFMEHMKKSLNMNYDKLVSYLIDNEN